MKIEITDDQMTTKEIHPKSGRDSFVIYEQAGRLALNGEIRNLVVSSRTNSPYPKGKYQIAEKSYYVDTFGGVKLGNLILEPVQ